MGKNILVVEDQQVELEMLGILLSQDEHTVVKANNGAEAFTIYRQGHFDLVITDYRLPFISGDELACKIKQVVPEQPILMISGCPQAIGPENPVDAFLRKPFGASRLRAMIDQLLPKADENLADVPWSAEDANDLETTQELSQEASCGLKHRAPDA
jgi:DNA-binding response OmpR family regulator